MGNSCCTNTCNDSCADSCCSDDGSVWTWVIVIILIIILLLAFAALWYYRRRVVVAPVDAAVAVADEAIAAPGQVVEAVVNPNTRKAAGAGAAGVVGTDAEYQ